MADELLVTVPEAARRLCIGRSTTYALLRNGIISSVTIGTLRRVPVADLENYILTLKEQAANRDGY